MDPPGLENCASWGKKKRNVGIVLHPRAHNESNEGREQRVELMLLTETYGRRGRCSRDTLDVSLHSIVFKETWPLLSRQCQGLCSTSVQDRRSFLRVHLKKKGSGGPLKYNWKTQASICLAGTEFGPESGWTEAAAVQDLLSVGVPSAPATA